MEADPNPFPELKLFEFPRVRRAVHFLFDHIHSEGLSDHARHEETPRDIGQLALFDLQADVDKQLYRDPLDAVVEKTNRWDDMGNYHNDPYGPLGDPRSIARDGEW